MRLIDIENQIKSLVEEDVTNPEIYNKIKDLAEYFLRWKHLVSGNEVEDVAYIIAEELYLKVYNGGTISSWIGYINRFYYAAIRVHRKMNGSEIIDTEDDVELANGIVAMSTSGSDYSSEGYKRILDNMYFESLPDVVDEVMRRSKYQEFTKEYMNSRFSIILSLCSTKFISYNLDKPDEMYTRMLYTLAKDLIIENVKANSGEDETYSNLSLLQLFTLSNASSNDS